MSIDLTTVSSAVVNGRCTGCGRFISRNESHFHSPPRKFRGRPKAHLYDWGEGALVTRCDDPAQALPLVLALYRRDIQDEEGEAERVFRIENARIERGRINVIAPGGEYEWWWMALPDDARGPGITTAVVWNP